ncbi:MAG: 30S ribosomal protein S20 [Proteobacteria bacterium]|nr:30S ribosomal protein S20 [Pseudomonadota bacterium]
MANSPQSIKRARQADVRRKRNQGVNTKFRTMVKRARSDVTDAETGKTMFSDMQAAADVAARKGIIHPRKASRLKQRINKSIRLQLANKADAPAAVEKKAEKK